MNKMNFTSIFKVVFTASCAVLSLSACNSDGEPDMSGITDDQFISQLLDAKDTGTYEVIETHWYACPTGESKWTERNPSEYTGFEWSLPSTIILENGKSHVPFEFFHCAYGSTVFSIPWGAYERKHGQEGIYLTHEFSYDSFQRTVTLGSQTYDVISFNENELQISYVSPYAGGETGNGGLHKEIFRYKRTDSPGIDGIKNHSFANTHEIYQFIIDKCREKFGDEFDVNAIYYPYVEFPRSILRLDDYQDFLQFMKDHNTYNWYDSKFMMDPELYHEYNRLMRLCSMSNPED